jgi:hypothetical protein
MKRPLAATIIGWLFIAAGTVGFLYHVREVDVANPLSNDALLVLSVRLLAIIGGVLVLKGSPIGRWLLVAWLAYHVVLSYFHPFSELITHALLMVVITCALFHPRIGLFFKKN